MTPERVADVQRELAASYLETAALYDQQAALFAPDSAGAIANANEAAKYRLMAERVTPTSSTTGTPTAD